MYARLIAIAIAFALATTNDSYAAGGVRSGGGHGAGFHSGGGGFGHGAGVRKIGNRGFAPGFGVGPGIGDGYGYGYGYWGGIGALYNGLDFYHDYRVPYFAAHPPVYYSHPVPRTYGHSPFAYPPHFSTPEIIETVAPLTINNPFVPESDSPASEAKDSDETVSAPATPRPLVVVNPYVTNSTLAQSGQ